MAMVSTFRFFAQKHSKVQLARAAKGAAPHKKRFRLLRRREVTTFQKCLAVHMHFAAMPRKLG
jgi:hypothetical protein